MSGFELPKRFWQKVDKGADTKCWNWTASTDSLGYGKFMYQGKCRRAHRILMQSKYPFPDHLVVRHTCDNPSCVNPAHLRIGTHADNVRDRDERGRGRWIGKRGESNSMCKLSAIIVKKLRTAHAKLPRFESGKIKNGQLRKLAERFGLPYGTVRNIVDGYQWNHI